MTTQSCLSSAHSTPRKSPRRVRFAHPIETAYDAPAVSIFPGPRSAGPIDSFAKQARQRCAPRVHQSLTIASAVTTMPYVPFARHETLKMLAAQQGEGVYAHAKTGQKATLNASAAQQGPLEACVEALNLDLVGVIDAVEDSTLVRYGGYAMMTGGAMIFVPVATIFLVSCVGLYAGLWGVKQISAIGASSARMVLGLPHARSPSPPAVDAALSARGHASWPTDTYTSDEEDL